MVKYNYAIFLAVVMMLGACSVMPTLNTFNERSVAVEVSFTEVVKNLTQWRKEGRLTDSEWASAKKDISDTQAVLDAMYLAKGAGDLATAEGKMSIANAGIALLRKYLVEKEAANVSK